MGQVARALLGALPVEVPIQVRTPRYKKAITGMGPMLDPRAYDGSVPARIGFHNDCAFSSKDDHGTFLTTSERDLLVRDARFVPVGGETCALHASNAPGVIVKALKNHRYTYLNGLYHADVVERWRTAGVLGPIAEQLGYRFELREAVVRPDPQGLRVRFVIENAGMAAPVRPRPFTVVVRAASGMRAWVLAEDIRRWAPGPQVLEAVLPVPSTTARTAVGLALRDPSPRLAARAEYAIRVLGTTWSDGINWLSATDLVA